MKVRVFSFGCCVASTHPERKLLSGAFAERLQQCKSIFAAFEINVDLVSAAAAQADLRRTVYARLSRDCHKALRRITPVYLTGKVKRKRKNTLQA